MKIEADESSDVVMIDGVRFSRKHLQSFIQFTAELLSAPRIEREERLEAAFWSDVNLVI